jgi:dTMP kinase
MAIYIALEGGDACGKSTQAVLLADALGALLTREPGGTTIGGLIRGVLLDPAHDAMVDRAEALLYAADRAQHVADVVEPALAAGRDVVSDRSAWSSVAYQGYGRGLGGERVQAINDWALGGRWPDLVVLLDLDPSEMAKRLRRAPDRLEQAGDGFHERVRDAYLTLATADPARWIVLDASGDEPSVAAAVATAVKEHLGRWGSSRLGSSR